MRTHADAQDAGPTTAAEPVAPVRYHELDALRGIAMVLGIVLHASMSFFPGFWIVVDDTARPDSWFEDLFNAIHGFRMPLFFLLSGFFTAMLWRRRGLRYLLWHRARRIALPLAIGFVTIVPAMNWTIEWAIDNGVDDYIDEHDDIWAAVFFGNTDAVDRLLDAGADVNAPNPAEQGDTPLHVAAFTGDADMAELLLERGADPDRRSGGGTPIEYAVYVGSEPVAELLLEAGATDPRPSGTEWADLEVWATGEQAAREAAAKFGLESWLTSFHHLWFLWFLLWLVAGFALVVLVSARLPLPAGGLGPWRNVLMWSLVPLSFLPYWFMGDRGALDVFGPDTSTGLVPVWHVLAFYACFFAFGAVLDGTRNRSGGPAVDRLGRTWPVVLPVAFVVALPVALHQTFDTDASWPLVAGLQLVYAWTAVVGLIGVFRAALGTERRGMRYLSDSAYWLYLAHLPLVIVAQSWIRHWDAPATLKFGLLTAGVTVVLLISYQLFVRYTPIGTMLNGPRRRPTRSEQR